MPAYALLLAHDDFPASTTVWPDQPGGPCDGWAEWFGTTPLLFQVLMGDARQLPQAVPCSAYADRATPSALAAPMAQVQARWQWLDALLQPSRAQWPLQARQQWHTIATAIQSSTRQWLLLDCATLCPQDFDNPTFTAFLQAQRDACLAWDGNSPTLPAALQPLCDDPEAHLGWWSPAVIARTAMLEAEHPDGWPEWLAGGYEQRYHGAWEDEVDAYVVMPRVHPHTGQPCASEDDDDDDDDGGDDSADARERWPVGLVTPYGRWLLRPELGASMVFATRGFIHVHLPATAPDTEGPSGLMDLNGRWQLPLSAGYRDLCVLTPHVLHCQSAQRPDRWDLRSMPGLELLESAVYSIEYQESDQTLRAARGEGRQEQALVLDVYGRPLMAPDYAHVGPFHAKNGLALCGLRLPAPDGQGTRLQLGLLHRDGTRTVDCVHERWICTTDDVPKPLPGGRLLAFGFDGRPHVYNTRGQLLANPDLWCPPFLRKLQKNAVLALRGTGDGAEMGWFSPKDFSFTPTGETWAEFSEALGAAMGLSRRKQPPQTMDRDALLAAEDAGWMQQLAHILCLQQADAAQRLLQDWRACVAAPDAEALGQDADDGDVDLDLMELAEGENALTLYWAHLLAVAPQIAHLDWKDADGLADSQGLPGAAGWHWDRTEDGDTMDEGLDSLARHLAAQDLALVRLATASDSLRFFSVRQADADTLLQCLDQAAVGAWLQGR